MQFFHFVIQAEPGDIIQLSFKGVGADIRLMNEFEFQRFCAGHSLSFRHYETSPVFLRPQSAGLWRVVVDFGGSLGSVTVPTILPWQLIRMILKSHCRIAPVDPPADTYRTYYTGELIQRADEIEVWYPDLHGIPHRGIIHSIQTGPMGLTITVIHNSKRGGGVSFISFADFEQGKLVNLRRRAESPQHADAVIARAESALEHPYQWRLANCEHFTDWCYTGKPGESDTLRAAALIAAGLGAVAVLWASEAR